MINLVSPIKLLELFLDKSMELYREDDISDFEASRADIVALIYYYRIYSGCLETFLADCESYDLEPDRIEWIRKTWDTVSKMTPTSIAKLAIENLHPAI